MGYLKPGETFVPAERPKCDHPNKVPQNAKAVIGWNPSPDDECWYCPDCGSFWLQRTNFTLNQYVQIVKPKVETAVFPNAGPLRWCVEKLSPKTGDVIFYRVGAVGTEAMEQARQAATLVSRSFAERGIDTFWIVLPAYQSLDYLDEAEMAEAGWVRADKPTVVEGGK